MLDGKWPQGGCEYCQKIENVGGVSDRQNHLKIPNLVPPELDSNPLAVNVSPRILEIYFNNTCNLACVYCWDGFSSKIEQENRKFGRFDQQGVVIENKSHATNQSDLTQVFWDWMKKNCQTLERLHILGGEPFYQADFYRCFDFFESNPCPKLELNVVSNLIVDSDTDIEKLRKAAKKIGTDMMEMPAIKSEVLAPFKMQGVADITGNAIVVRFKFTARPGNPAAIQREAIKRMFSTFPALGFEFAKDGANVVVHTGTTSNEPGGEGLSPAPEPRPAPVNVPAAAGA